MAGHDEEAGESFGQAFFPEAMPEDPATSYIPERSANLSRAETDPAAWPDGPVASPTVPVGSGYRLESLVDRGGFGEVWQGVQVSLGRVIAIKRLRPDLMREAGRSEGSLRALADSLRQEAMTAATLEHPNIVPVHDLYEAEDGEPRLAMKLVRGKPWQRLIAEDFPTLPIEDFLARHLPILISIGHAVAFAHSRGIVHRDLKPSQAMVGEFGEVLLMDWGLAVSWSSGSESRELGPVHSSTPPISSASSPAGTACFMAPEQTLPKADQVGPWTDVYLLGGILYLLLTGHPPHRGKTSAVAFFQASEGAVDDPRTFVPEGRALPDELVALAMRALSKERFARVASASAFVDALAGYLSGANRREESRRLAEQAREVLGGNPSAAREEAIYRSFPALEAALSKWPDNREARALIDASRLRLRTIRKRRILAAGAITATVLVFTIAYISYFAWQANNLRAEAEASRDRALRVANVMVEDLALGLRPLAGTQSTVVRDVIEKATEVYDELASAAPETEELARSRFRAVNALVSARMTTGDFPGALGRLRTAMIQASPWVEKNAADFTWLDEYNNALLLEAEIHRIAQDHPATIASLTKAKELIEAFDARHPGEPRIPLRLARLELRLSDAHHMMSSLQPAQEAAARARTLLERALDLLPDDPEALDLHAKATKDQATNLLYRGDFANALPMLARSVESYRAIMNADPDNAEKMLDYLQAKSLQGSGYLWSGEHAPAEEAFNEVLATARRLVALDGDNAEYRIAEFSGAFSLAELAARQDDAEKALARIAEAQVSVLDQRRRDPTSLTWANAEYRLLGLAGEAHTLLGDRIAAREAIRRAIVIAREVSARNTADSSWRYRVADALVAAARTHHPPVNTDERDAGIAMLDEADAIMQDLSASMPMTREQKHVINVISQYRQALLGDVEPAPTRIDREHQGTEQETPQ